MSGSSAKIFPKSAIAKFNKIIFIEEFRIFLSQAIPMMTKIFPSNPVTEIEAKTAPNAIESMKETIGMLEFFRFSVKFILFSLSRLQKFSKKMRIS